MNVDTAFPSRYIKAADLGESQPVVVISRVEMGDVGQGAQKERKPIVYFEGKEKGLVLNKTNAHFIKQIAGSADTDEWTGVKIRLIATEVEFQGTLTLAIRVRNPKPLVTPKPVSAPVDTPDESDIPF